MELLNKIWDDAPGQRAVLYKKGGQKKGGRNEFFADSASAYTFIQQKNADGYDVWFALALFGDDPKRTQSNAKTVKSFWLDIDVGSDKPYGTISDAASSLASFCDSLNLALPTLVSSGTGLHAHWIVDTRIAKDRWETTAKALKLACTRLGLKAGPERTADIASVLRIPGTKHLKDPLTPKAVELIGEVQSVVSLVDFEKTFARYIHVDSKRAANKVFETTMPQLPYDADKIAEGCAVVREMRDTKGCVPEPQWYATIQVLTHCIDGERISHEWSNGYEGYDHDVTQQKFERASEFGPTLCNRFGELKPEACASCPHNGKISTPLQLGQTVQALVPRQPVAADNGNNSSRQTLSSLTDHTGELDSGREGDSATETVSQDEAGSGDSGTSRHDYLPRFITPPKYQVGEQGVLFYDDDAEKHVHILDSPCVVTRLTDSVHECDMEARIEWRPRNGKWRASTMRVDTLMEMRETGKWLAARGIVGFNPRNLEAVKNYLWACIQVYQHQNQVERVYERFGWSPDGFVLGTTLLTGTGEEPAHLASRVPMKMRKYLVSKGEIEQWAKATETLNHEKYLPQRFALTAAFGSVLFSLMGVQGAVLSLAGDSGVGKTTIGLFGLSAFGDPRALEISPQSTERAFHELWYVAGNLPVLINEAATLDLYKLSSLIYAAANGQARSVLTRNSELRESDGWQLLSIFTSNSHLLSLDEKWLNEANRRRILELTLTKPEHEMDRQCALTLHRTMAKHYGSPGRKFIQYCVANRKTIEKTLRDTYEAYAKGDIPAEHRFSLWVIAATVVAGRIARELDLLRFDTDQACAYAADQIRQQARNVKATEERVDDLLARYIEDHQGMFTTYAEKEKFWASEVRGQCAGRYVRHKNGKTTLAVPVNKFALYASESAGLDKQQLSKWAKDRKVKSKSVQIVPNGMPSWSYIMEMTSDDGN